MFKITSEEDLNNPVIANTSTGAWAEILKRVTKLKVSGTAVSGPEMFGFVHPTIQKFIQEMNNARECKNYEFIEFVESKKQESS